MVDLWLDVDANLAEVPINKAALIDDTDFKTREESVVFNQAGLDLLWNFTTTAGAFSQTAVTPTNTGGNYDFVNQGNGFYTIEIPASGGVSINNDTEGFGFFSGFATGILPWVGPIIGFRAAALNNALIDGGDNLDVNVTEVSGDSTAADNLELDYDGTGYAKANSTVGTVTTLTNKTGFSLAADQSAVTIGTVNALASGERTLIGTAVWATTVRALTVVTGFGLAADQSAVTIGTVNALASGAIIVGAFAANSITASALAADAATEIGAAVRDTGGFLATDATYTIGKAMRDIRAYVRGGIIRTGYVYAYYNDNGDGSDPSAGTLLFSNRDGDSKRTTT